MDGSQGLKLGLVDTLGGIDEAIALAAKLASVTDYRIVQYPQVKDEWGQVMKLFSKQSLNRNEG